MAYQKVPSIEPSNDDQKVLSVVPKMVELKSNKQNKEPFTSDHQGYVLVFKNNKENKQHLIIFNDLIKDLDSAEIRYMIRIGGDLTFIVCYISQKTCETWAEKHGGIEISVHPNMIKEPYVTKTNDKHDEYLAATQNYLYIHLPFSATKNAEFNGELFRHREYTYDDLDGKIRHCTMSNCNYLRILYTILTDDKHKSSESPQEYYGAGIKADKYLMQLSHPLVAFYPLSARMDRVTFSEFFKIHSIKSWNPYGVYMQHSLEEMREFYGEYVAFYFAWGNYYAQCLGPMCIFGIVWGIIQLIETIFKFDITRDGFVSLIGIVISVAWSTTTNELWYRQENYLRIKWGMVNYQKIETPMPLFEGKYVNGIEIHKSLFVYWGKIVISYIVILALLAALTTAYVFILKFNEYADAEDKYSFYILLAIGFAISTLMLIVNYIFMFIAICLNNWENHRLRSTSENHLGVKLVTFRFVSTFYSIFWLAFMDNQQQSDQERVYNVRFQLVTLFVLSLLCPNIISFFWYQYGMDVLCYKRNKKLKKVKLHRVTSRSFFIDSSTNDNSNNNDDNDKPDLLPSSSKNQHSRYIDECVWNDIQFQLTRPVLPEILYNYITDVISHGYIMIFSAVFPLTALLVFINNFFKGRLQYFNLLNARRPHPWASPGIGIWKIVMSAMNIFATVTNMGFLIFRTSSVDAIFQTSLDKNGEWIWFGISCVILVTLELYIRVGIKDVSDKTWYCYHKQKELYKYIFNIEPRKNSVIG